MISVIIPTKNGGKWIRKAIESVQVQSEQNVEIVIVNDGSVDDTSSTLDELQRLAARIRIITNDKSMGPGASRHEGILHATGDLIALIDDDDRWISKDKLKIQKDFLDSKPDAVLVGSAKNDFIKEDGTPFTVRTNVQPRTDAAIRRRMLWRNPFVASSVMFRKDAYLKTGGFASMYLAEDYDLWMRLGTLGTMANLDHCEIAYMVRQSGANKSRQQEMNKIVLGLTKKYKSDYPFLYPLALLKSYARVWLFDLKNIF